MRRAVPRFTPPLTASELGELRTALLRPRFDDAAAQLAHETQVGLHVLNMQIRALLSREPVDFTCNCPRCRRLREEAP
jgi:hypothetical protein